MAHKEAMDELGKVLQRIITKLADAQEDGRELFLLNWTSKMDFGEWW